MHDLDRLRTWLAGAIDLDRRVLIKRLSANDTGANGSHQVGPYVPNRVAFLVAPELDSDQVDPRRSFALDVVSHGQQATPNLIYYNNRRRGFTRNESRITSFGGRSSAFQDPGNTGALLVLSFSSDGRSAEAWISRDLGDEELIESTLGDIDPGAVVYLGPDESGRSSIIEPQPLPRCRPTLASLPAEWLEAFPHPMDLVDEAARLIPARPRISPDSLLMDRYACTYAMYRLLEEAHWLPLVSEGFQTIDSFLGTAQTILQRRKARAGRNLEGHLEVIFREYGVRYSAQVETEPSVRPDFVFPSIQRYRDAQSAAGDLDVLASKSTLRDRWHSVTREGAKVPLKHLFTLDEGLAAPQFVELENAGIRLVVPQARLRSYPKELRTKVLTLQQFIDRRIGVQARAAGSCPGN